MAERLTREQIEESRKMCLSNSKNIASEFGHEDCAEQEGPLINAVHDMAIASLGTVSEPIHQDCPKCNSPLVPQSCAYPEACALKTWRVTHPSGTVSEERLSDEPTIRWVAGGKIYGNPTASDLLEAANTRLADPEEMQCVSGDERMKNIRHVRQALRESSGYREAVEDAARIFDERAARHSQDATWMGPNREYLKGIPADATYGPMNGPAVAYLAEIERAAAIRALSPRKEGEHHE